MTLTPPESTPVALRGPRGQVLALTLAALATLPGVVVAGRRDRPRRRPGPGALRARHPRFGVPPGLGGGDAPARRLPGPRAHRARAHRGAARVRRRLHLRVQGRRGPRQVRAARAGQHDRRQPAPHRHRVVDGGAARRVAHDADRPASAATRASSTPTCTSSGRTRSRSRSSRSRPLYSLTLPLKHTLTLVDSVDPHHDLRRFVYPALAARRRRNRTSSDRRARSATLPTTQRRIVVGILLVYAAGVIFAVRRALRRVARPPRRAGGVDTFLLVQWVAPLASEAPELVVAGLFAWRLNTSAGLRHAAVVEGEPVDAARRLAPDRLRDLGRPPHGLPLDSLQREELFLTAAQSVFAIAVLVSRSISVREASMLFGLFIVAVRARRRAARGLREWERIGVGIVYLVLAAVILVQQRACAEAAGPRRPGRARRPAVPRRPDRPTRQDR